MQFQTKHKQVAAGGGSQHPDMPTAVSRRGEAAYVFSLWEVMMAFAVVALMFGIIINGYVLAAKRSQWSGYSLAAQSLGMQTIEQLRSAAWDPSQPSKMVEATNLTLLGKVNTLNSSGGWSKVTGYMTNTLDVPWKGTNYVLATNWVTVQLVQLTYNTNITVQLVRVDTIWPFNGWGNFTMKYYTNTICTLIAPDNRDPSTLGD